MAILHHHHKPLSCYLTLRVPSIMGCYIVKMYSYQRPRGIMLLRNVGIYQPTSRSITLYTNLQQNCRGSRIFLVKFQRCLLQIINQSNTHKTCTPLMCGTDVGEVRRLGSFVKQTRRHPFSRSNISKNTSETFSKDTVTGINV